MFSVQEIRGTHRYLISPYLRRKSTLYLPNAKITNIPLGIILLDWPIIKPAHYKHNKAFEQCSVAGPETYVFWPPGSGFGSVRKK
jgi:hypothetical protein